ncbi:Uncharacterised protein [Legionella lansingensis]|uniref:DUF3757 domain-containing protein n=1 Tax=Legionella lansingensis TaxID=45067 RepID=A0A0W0VVR8_9GAMM|nr:DUF3757 domain-containing protein [Legionella lansingensis]KTD24368.1 hypothetical protein Llan_0507 [Legionella lansingensis]SNV51652.1 Uncharacterised protein [Legionella lansingensis]
MKQIILAFCLLSFFFVSLSSKAQISTCPDPNTTSLKWGVIPEPWVLNPYSAHRPQGDKNTRFVRSNIVVAGTGRGVVCSYENSVGIYSIWWPVPVKIPARTDYNWIEIYGGYVCTQSLSDCQFSVAS